MTPLANDPMARYFDCHFTDIIDTCIIDIDLYHDRPKKRHLLLTVTHQLMSDTTTKWACSTSDWYADIKY